MENIKIWKKIEILGDIAVIPIPFEYDERILKSYADEILKKYTYVKSVWGKLRDTSGKYRLSTLIHLAGEKKSDTIYKEHGCRYYLDITKVFFSTKLSYEHLRVASLVRENEKIINMFAGFGPFSILSCVKKKPQIVYSIDINPYAYYFQKVNVELNKAYCVLPIYGDAFKRIYDLEDADRIISPLPELADEALEVALQKVKKGGIIHLYAEIEVKKGENPVKKAMEKYPNGTFYRIVRSINPSTYHVVIDILVK
ncbi:MAG: class I SAM-dependent methyltransferase family protein [Sulfolobaceae archaeon]